MARRHWVRVGAGDLSTAGRQVGVIVRAALKNLAKKKAAIDEGVAHSETSSQQSFAHLIILITSSM
jgi:hypothetical protein